MNKKPILLIVPLLIAAVGIGIAVSPSAPLLAAGCDYCEEAMCPCCQCQVKAEVVDVKKDCYCVKKVKICVPKVKLPFSASAKCKTCRKEECNCCVCPGAKCKTVKVLVKKEYKCKECKCVWTPVCCGGACDDGCDATVPGIIKEGCDAGHHPPAAGCADGHCGVAADDSAVMFKAQGAALPAVR